MSVGDDEKQCEQRHLDLLYARLDELRREAAANLGAVRLSDPGGNQQARSERDAFATLYEDQLARLNSVEEQLCFGRIDDLSHASYIGRIGMSDDNSEQLLIDWRAPAAEPFYQATARTPLGLVRRRHLVTKARELIGIEDDVLDLSALDDTARAELSGEGALIAALDSARTGRMDDIVATIQAEQDTIIRGPLAGVLVVQGGPGTGKTAVALHRAAFLLYKYRERIAGSGVLLIGPTTAFLKYIGQVLPSLGETGAVLSTPGQLFPGVDTDVHDGDELAALKGDALMARALRKAAADRQRLPERDQVLAVDSRTVTLTVADVRSARDRARRTGKPHNEARTTFVKTLLRKLTDRIIAQIGETFDEGDRAELLTDVRSARDVRVALNLAWMPLTPEKLLGDLYALPHLLESAASWLTPGQRELFRRADPHAWTVEDVPLLDEAAELLGDDPSARQREDAVRREQDAKELAFAESVIDMTGQHGYVSADTLSGRFADTGPARTTAERAAADRTWAYGHVVVDEAQELSPMMWRTVLRRVPSKSMTLVGDIAQTSAAAGATSWHDALRPLLGDRWNVEELTINYRTPRQIMDAATAMIRSVRPDVSVPSSVREGRWPPIFTKVGDPIAELPGLIDDELALLDGGRLAVIGPGGVIDAAADALTSAGRTDIGRGPAGLDADVALLRADQAKGLEFDGVVVLEPGLIDKGVHGISDVYVAMTRPTRRLVIVYSEALPDALAQRNARS
ncbi:HelD family protein [Spelaeicoccus albus]|uniref:DNA helicase IV n=1 Tax=Spelaeicoccus albus TaxID=1280376 RepID=A0A7Z0D3G9_9MICO|nr:DNA helicase [Spelaeicoccus albus]NYI68146.1 DNA helicase IV [Spelaeicoccus albus]